MDSLGQRSCVAMVNSSRAQFGRKGGNDSQSWPLQVLRACIPAVDRDAPVRDQSALLGINIFKVTPQTFFRRTDEQRRAFVEHLPPTSWRKNSDDKSNLYHFLLNKDTLLYSLLRHVCREVALAAGNNGVVVIVVLSERCRVFSQRTSGYCAYVRIHDF